MVNDGLTLTERVCSYADGIEQFPECGYHYGIVYHG
jgi:hypothetical protein